MFYKCLLFLFFIFNIIITESLNIRLNNCSIPTLANGKVRYRQRARKLAKFICNPGFEIAGNKFATCRNGEWDNPIPICVRSGCDTPSHLENGIVLVMRNDAEVLFFCTPGHRLVGSSTIYCDGLRWNDTMPVCVDSNAPPQLTCDFEDSRICGWTQDELHDFDWRRLNKKTPSSFLYTGPSADHTPSTNGTGFYMYIESTSRKQNDTARLLSPIYSGSLAKNGCFSFYYHMFGKTTGGLRVYQKPELYPLSTLLSLTGENMKKYILFEKWGNQGDFWYGSVNKLSDFSDNFQIVIEGIRGLSFTSDIAIDDVALLQGEEACNLAESAIVTPNPNIADSCSGRCDLQGKEGPVPPGGCSCTATCVIESDCCSDFYDVCLFTNDAASSGDEQINSDDKGPQTEKLVATKPSEPTEITTEEITTKTTKATIKSTTNNTTTKLITTPRKGITLVFKTTPTPPINGGKASVTVRTSTKPTTKSTILSKPTSTLKPTTKKLTTMKVKTTVFQKYVDEKKKEPDNAKASSSMKTLAIVVGVLLVISGCVYLTLSLRGSRGISTIALISRTARNDPEVTFLTRNDALEED